MTEERRQSTFRRQVNEAGWPDIGKALCAYILYINAKPIIDHWDALFVLGLFLIAPRNIEKVINARWGSGTTTTETSSSSRKVTT